MIELLVGTACYLSFFANMGSIGPVMQVLALGLLLGAASYTVLVNRMKAIPVTATELVLYVVGTVSLALCMLQGEDSTAAVSVGLLATLILISVIIRAISLERLMDTGAVVMLLCVLTSLLVERGSVITALSISIGRGGLVRFMPLGNYPNLAGYLFGAGCVLMMRRVFVSRSTLERFLMFFGAMLSGVFVIAASARSSLIALFAAGAVAVCFEFRISRILSSNWARFALSAMIIFCFAFIGKISTYFGRILELDSSTRGVASGGSGRTGLWARGIATLFDDPIIFTFGGGFRSSGSDLIGFSTESSYITILLDSGLFIGAAVIFVFWYSPIKALKLSAPQDRYSSPLLLLPSFLTFLLVESIFNRYLLAVGNPISLMTLLVLFGLSVRASVPSGTARALREWTLPPRNDAARRG